MAEKRVIEQVASNEVHNDDWFLKDSPTQDTSKISATNLKAILGADGTLALEEIANAIAEEYDSTATYNKDDFVFYNNKLYRCLADNTTGTWDGAKWKEFDLPTDLITTAHNIETAEFTIGTYYSADDLVLKDGKLYQCVVFHNATEWKSQFWRAVTVDTMLDYLSSSLAPEHNPSTVYAVGDLVTHNKALWRCTQAGAGAFVNANWEEVTVVSLIAEAGQIDDVKVDGVSVVDENKVAQIDLSAQTIIGSVENLPADIATFTDGADNKPMKALQVGIEPVQDLHGYDAPWAGGAGKNKWEFNSSLSGNGNVLSGKVFTKPIPAGTYTLSCKGAFASGGAMAFRFVYTDNTNIDATLGYNVQSGTYYVIAIFEKEVRSLSYVYSNNANNSINSIQLEQGNQFTSYAPYSNICPISGWSEANIYRYGKNFFDGNLPSIGTAIKYRAIYVGEGTFTMSTTCPYSTESNACNLFFLSGNVSDGASSTQNGVSASRTRTVTSVDGYVTVAYRDYNSVNPLNYNTQIELGDTATTYESYAGNLIIVAFGQTLYGGYIDWENNRIVGTHRIFEVTKNNSGLSVIQIGSTGHYRIRFYTTGAKSYGVNDVFDGVCNFYKPVSSNATYGRTVGVGIQSGNVAYIYDTIWDYQTALDDFKTWLDSNPITLTYELATPVIIPLQLPQVKSLEGVNNLFADCGPINKAEYQRDATTIINELIARIEALEG